MSGLWEFVLRHGYALLFAVVFIEQAGAPIPALPVLVTMGALAGLGHFSLLTALMLAVGGAMAGDWLWFELGRRRGAALLSFLCKLSLEPDSCVRQTHKTWDRYGPRTLLVAKFIPGISTVSTTLAGATGMSRARFIGLDSAGTFFWAGGAMAAGFLLRHEAEKLLEVAAAMGSKVLLLLIALLAAWLGWKFYQRHAFIRQLRMARIEPEELLRRLDAGDAIVLIDLRSRFELEETAALLPGALWMEPEEAHRRASELAGLGELIFYCS